jgi:DNA-binding transcriptional LysR family regulator
MRVENAELEAFVLVAELGNFQRAADKLHLTQPGLSRRIQKLEQTLGVELFHRTTRSIELTGVGRHFLPMARQQMAQLGLMLSSIQEIAEKRFGKIRLASIPTVLTRVLPPVLQRYAERYPHIGVQMFDGNHDFVVGQVRAGIAEFGISMDPGEDDDLAFTPLLADQFVVAVHQDHPLARAERLSLRDLRDARLIIGGRDSGNRLLLELLLGQEALSLRWFYEVEHVSCLMALVEAGLGCAIVPSLALSALPGAHVRAVPIVEPEIRRRIGLIRHKTMSMSPLSGEFCEMLLAACAGESGALIAS